MTWHFFLKTDIERIVKVAMQQSGVISKQLVSVRDRPELYLALNILCVTFFLTPITMSKVV